jgi:hypothetical protein
MKLRQNGTVSFSIKRAASAVGGAADGYNRTAFESDAG